MELKARSAKRKLDDGRVILGAESTVPGLWSGHDLRVLFLSALCLNPSTITTVLARAGNYKLTFRVESEDSTHGLFTKGGVPAVKLVSRIRDHGYTGPISLAYKSHPLRAISVTVPARVLKLGR